VAFILRQPQQQVVSFLKACTDDTSRADESSAVLTPTSDKNTSILLTNGLQNS
jgi:hypothetical protein